MIRQLSTGAFHLLVLRRGLRLITLIELDLLGQYDMAPRLVLNYREWFTDAPTRSVDALER